MIDEKEITQEHFSLMGQALIYDDETPDEEKIEELLWHARKELNQASKLVAPPIFRAAKGSLVLAHLLNDMCTAFLDALCRIDPVMHAAWNRSGRKFEETEGRRNFLKRALVPEIPDEIKNSVDNSGSGEESDVTPHKVKGLL